MLERIDTIIALLQTIADQLSVSEKTSENGTGMPPEELPGRLTPWITAEQVMEYLQITDSTYSRWLEDGTLEPRGPGRHRYYVSDIGKLMKQRRLRKRREKRPKTPQNTPKPPKKPL